MAVQEATLVHTTPAGSAGGVHWPEVLLPQQATDPSERSAMVCELPVATERYERPAGSGGTLHAPGTERGDVGDLAKLIQAHAGVRSIDDCHAKLGHELSDCLWSILVLASKCGIDLQAEFAKNTREISDYVSGELAK